jgi:hypothetical protein
MKNLLLGAFFLVFAAIPGPSRLRTSSNFPIDSIDVSLTALSTSVVIGRSSPATEAGGGVPSLSPSGPIVISGRNGTVIQGLKITSTSGDCVRIINSRNITIQNSEIGPCAGHGVAISGGEGISVFDSYIHPETLSRACCDHNDGIYALETANLRIQGNVIAYGESNIEVQGGETVTVTGNFLLNPRDEQGGVGPRGNNFQCWSHSGREEGRWCKNVTVSNNYALSSRDTAKYLYPEETKDSINFGYTDGILAQNNFITGGHSKAGCGLIADKGANNAQFRDNRLLDAGQCGIGIADGRNHVVDSNKVLNRTPVPGSGNQGIYVWQFYKDKGGNCGSVRVSNNITLAYKTDGSKSGFWKGSGCDPMTQENNVAGAAATKLLTDQLFEPPLIPPQPRNCVVQSPYTTQTNGSPCVLNPGN